MSDPALPTAQPMLNEVRKIPGLAELKPVSIVGAILYGLGLIVANSYFSTFGYHDFSLLKPQAILTGGWAAIFLFCAALPAIVSQSAWKKSQSHPVLRFLRGLLAFVLTLAAVTVVASVISKLLGISSNTNHQEWGTLWLPHWELTPPGWGTLLLIMNLFPFISLTRADDSLRDKLQLRHIAYQQVILALIGAVWLGIQMYPAVSPIIGGGRAEQNVEFVFSKDGCVVASRIMAKFEGAEPAPVQMDQQLIMGNLLYQNSDVFALEIRTCIMNKLVTSNVLVDKKLVSAYFPSGLLFPPDPLNQEYCNPTIIDATRLDPGNILLIQGTLGRCRVVSSWEPYRCVNATITDAQKNRQRLEIITCDPPPPGLPPPVAPPPGSWVDVHSCQFKIPAGWSSKPANRTLIVSANGVSSAPYIWPI